MVRQPTSCARTPFFHSSAQSTSGTGDLHVRVQLWTPERLADEEERLIRRLGEIQRPVPADRGKGLWAKMREALGA